LPICTPGGSYCGKPSVLTKEVGAICVFVGITASTVADTTLSLSTSVACYVSLCSKSSLS